MRVGVRVRVCVCVCVCIHLFAHYNFLGSKLLALEQFGRGSINRQIDCANQIINWTNSFP